MKLIALVGLLAGTAGAMSCPDQLLELRPSSGVLPTQPVLVLTLGGTFADTAPEGFVFRSGNKVIPATLVSTQVVGFSPWRRLPRQHFLKPSRPLSVGQWTLEVPKQSKLARESPSLGTFSVTTKPMPAIFLGPPRFLGFEQGEVSGGSWLYGRIAATGPTAAAVLAEVRLTGLNYARTVVVGLENGEAHFGNFGCWSLPHLPTNRHLTLTITPVALDGLRGDSTTFEVDIPGRPGIVEPTDEEMGAMLDGGTIPPHLNGYFDDQDRTRKLAVEVFQQLAPRDGGR